MHPHLHHPRRSLRTTQAHCARRCSCVRRLRLEMLPPVQGEPSPIGDRALAQHDLLIARLRALGVKATVLDSDPSVPMGVAAADIAVVLASGAVMMRPSELGRRSEVVRVEAALGEAGIPVIGRIEPPGILDGGDVIVASDAVYVAVPENRGSSVGIPRAQRGNALGRCQFATICESFGLRTVEVKVAGEVTRLRGVASLVDNDTIVLAPGLIDAGAFVIANRIEVPRGEDYAAGVLCVGPRRVLENVRFRETLPVLRRAKLSVDAIDLWEFGKVGLSPSTLVLALKRS